MRKKNIIWIVWTVIIMVVIPIAQIYSTSTLYSSLIITFGSFLIWSVDKYKYRVHHQNYKKSKDEKKKIEEEIYQLYDKHNLHKLERYEHNLKISELEERLITLDVESSNEIERLEQTIDKLKEKTSKLTHIIQKSKETISTLESKEHTLREKLVEKLKFLEHDKKHKEHERMLKKLHQLELLWRYDPSWSDRKGIESIVSLKNTHLPFTLTQAFISFDKLILSKVQKYKPNADGQNTNLFNNIQFIIEEYHLPMHMQDELHQIRKARNRWFHDGIYPSYEIIEVLIKLLHDVEAKVFL
jgi:hypothetical protein